MQLWMFSSELQFISSTMRLFHLEWFCNIQYQILISFHLTNQYLLLLSLPHRSSSRHCRTSTELFQFSFTTSNLHCNGSSSFPVTYSWRRVNSSLNITDQANGYNSSTLVILETQHSDEGWYQCVTCVFGVESFSDPAYLIVKGIFYHIWLMWCNIIVV